MATQQRHMKTRSWRKACFFRLNEIAVSNCHIIFNEWHEKFDWKFAKEQLADDLLSLVVAVEKPPLPMKRRHRKVPMEERLNRALGHFPGREKSVRGNCVVHGKVRKRCSSFCTTCQVFLCLGNCYRVFHSEEHEM